MSRITSLIPVILLFAIVGVAAYVGYQIYLYTQELAHKGQDSMAKRNITLTSDGGMKVGVKQMSQEEYADKTQKKVVEAWNLSSWPEYKSRLWNQDADINKRSSSHRSPVSRHASDHGSSSSSHADHQSGSHSGAKRPGIAERSSSWLHRHHSHER